MSETNQNCRLCHDCRNSFETEHCKDIVGYDSCGNFEHYQSDNYIKETLALLYKRNEMLNEQLKNTVQLPCNVGDTVYHLYKAGNVITEDRLFKYIFEKDIKPCVEFENYYYYGMNKRKDTILLEQFGVWWFTSKESAEARLKELQGDKE